MIYLCQSDDNFVWSVLIFTFLCVPGTEVIRLESKHLSPLGPLVSPLTQFLTWVLRVTLKSLLFTSLAISPTISPQQ